MAWVKNAKAVVSHRGFKPENWSNFVDHHSNLLDRRYKIASNEKSLVHRASEILGEELSLDKYLLSHCSIVASVDTIDVPNVKLGNVQGLTGRPINRMWSNYRITPETQEFINNNADSFPREVLLSAYPTFIGAFNFLEHLQIAEHSKGKIIDAVARDIGPSVYVDILVATAKKHTQLVRDIEDGTLGTLSMGCFLAGTKVIMAEGAPKNIEDILPGEKVITHTGASREVVNKQIKFYKGSLITVKADSINPIQATANHGFEVKGRGKVRADELQIGDWLCGQKVLTGPCSPNQSFHQVTSLSTSHYEGPVHNMEVEEDHTYLVEGVAVYNCTVSHTQCTKCGNVAVDETDVCDCQKYERGNTFIDEMGNLQKVAELCGNKDLDHPTKGVKFIEASWVKVPAFTGAVMRNIVKPEVITLNTQKQAQNILSAPPSKWVKEEGVRSKAAFDFGDEGGEEAPAEEPKEEKKSPLDELEDETESYILDNVRNRIQEKLKKKNQSEAATGELAVSSNDNIQKTAVLKVAYERDVNVLLKIAKNDADFMNNLSIINRDYGINIDRNVYQAALQVGSTTNFVKSASYIQECERYMGRKVNRKEAHNLVCLGQILSMLEKRS